MCSYCIDSSYGYSTIGSKWNRFSGSDSFEDDSKYSSNRILNFNVKQYLYILYVRSIIAAESWECSRRRRGSCALEYVNLFVFLNI